MGTGHLGGGAAIARPTLGAVTRILAILLALAAPAAAELLQLGEALDTAVSYHPEAVPPELVARLAKAYEKKEPEIRRLLRDPKRVERASREAKARTAARPDPWRRPLEHLLALGPNEQGREEYWNPRTHGVMVQIPGGRVKRGYLYAPETRPIRTVSRWGFLIDKREITVGQYERFLDETGRTPPRSWVWQWVLRDRPVVDVTFEDARAYARWAGCRLPLEEEWVRAAMGPERRLYPWGIHPPRWEDLPRGSTGRVPYPDLSYFPRPAGSAEIDVSPDGVLDMAGNVREWCDGLISAQWARAKGGSYVDEPGKAFPHLHRVFHHHPRKRFRHVGFRLAMPLPPGRLGGHDRPRPRAPPRIRSLPVRADVR